MGVATAFLDGFAMTPDDHIGIVGVGGGTLVALQLAREMIFSRRIVPAGFWTICGPTVLPAGATAQCPGALIDCPVRYLVSQTSRAGAPWRYEVQAFGLFSQGLYKNRADLLRMLSEEVSQMGTSQDAD